MTGHLLDLVDIRRRQPLVDTGGETEHVAGPGFPHALDGETDTLTLKEVRALNRSENPVLKDRLHRPLHKPLPSDGEGAISTISSWETTAAA